MPTWLLAAIVAALIIAGVIVWVWMAPKSLGDAKARLDLAKGAIELAAIGVAALWTYQRFLQIDAPSLRNNFAIEMSLERDSAVSAPKCLMIVNTKARNASKAPLEVTRARQRVWILPDSVVWRGGKSGFIYLDTLLGRVYPPTDSIVFSSGEPLVYSYAPDAQASFAFPWLEAEMDSSQTVLARFDFSFAGQDSADFSYTWGKPCVRPRKSRK